MALALMAAGATKAESVTDAVALAYLTNPTLDHSCYDLRAADKSIVQASSELRPTAEHAQAEKALLAAQLDVVRGEAIADALSGNSVYFARPTGTPPDVAETQRRPSAAQVVEIDASTLGMAAARSAPVADAQAAADQIQTFDKTAPVLDRELDAVHDLIAKGYPSGLKLMKMERQRHSETGERDVAVAQEAKGMSDTRKYGDQLSQTCEQARQAALTVPARAESEARQRQEELTTVKQKSHLERLVAPVDGTLQQFAVHTIGGVVEPVRPLLVFVPYNALAVEANVLNKDAGFAHRGQEFAVKLEAFPFTRSGTVPGRIKSASSDLVDGRKVGPVYVARVTLLRSMIDRGDRVVSLEAGMAATADIRTGRRPILSYLQPH